MVAKEEKERWHYFAVKKLSALLHKKTSYHKGDFSCLNCFYSFSTENKLKSHEEVCENKVSVKLKCHQKKKQYNKFSQYTKMEKMPYIIYADL